MKDVTAVLITTLKKYPEIVLERLTCVDFFKDISIVAECPSIYHRYLAASKVGTDHVFVMDDDCLMNFQVLYESYDGKTITNGMPAAFQEKYNGLGCTLVGWGCFFPKVMVEKLDLYVKKYGIDKHLLREADRIFTYLNQPFNTVTMPHEDLTQEEGRMGYQPGHYESMHEALKKCEKLVFNG